MLSIRGVSGGSGYRAYVAREGRGIWVGTGAKILGLPQEVTAEEWRAIRMGKHPETGENLRSRRVVDRWYEKPWGMEIHKARSLYDLTLSAPKTVSVMSIVDERISEAHRYASEQTWRLMEQKCGAMVIASYQHHTSRSLDPQEHTHLVAANLAFDGDKWRTLHVNNLYRSQEEITERYRESLLVTLEREGYRIRYPELADVPAEIVDRFSQRSKERDEGIREYAAYHDLRPEDLTNKERAQIVRNYRQEKVVLPIAQVRDGQLSRLTPAEREYLIEIRESAHGPRERMRLSSNIHYEPELTHERWDYGERITP